MGRQGRCEGTHATRSNAVAVKAEEVSGVEVGGGEGVRGQRQ